MMIYKFLLLGRLQYLPANFYAVNRGGVSLNRRNPKGGGRSDVTLYGESSNYHPVLAGVLILARNGEQDVGQPAARVDL